MCTHVRVHSVNNANRLTCVTTLPLNCRRAAKTGRQNHDIYDHTFPHSTLLIRANIIKTSSNTLSHTCNTTLNIMTVQHIRHAQMHGRKFLLNHLHTSARCVCKQLKYKRYFRQFGPHSHKISGCLLRAQFRFMGLALPNISVREVHFWLLDQGYRASLQLMNVMASHLSVAVPKMGSKAIHMYTASSNGV